MLTTDESVLETLRELMLASDSDTARIQAAKILLERLAPKEDDEAKKREAEEREAALAQASGLLAEFAALKLASFRLTRELDRLRAAGAADAAGDVAGMAGHGGPGVGEDAHGG
ncbi:MAG: hypothetical protein PHS57_06790 [Alphaproteobacteria bacterium]|nr:hypothetical protein [Alphaproteobacteria bacterium]